MNEPDHTRAARAGQRRSFSLTARLLLVMGGLIIGTALLLSAISLYLLNAELDRGVQVRLSSAKTLADTLIDARVSEAARLARAVAVDPYVQEAQPRGASEALHAALERYAPAAPEAVLVAVNQAGEPLDRSGPAGAPAARAWFAAAARGDVKAGLSALEGCRIWAISTYPIQTGARTTGAVLAQLPLSQQLVDTLRASTQLEGWLYCGDRAQGTLLGGQALQLDAGVQETVFGSGQVSRGNARLDGMEVYGYHVPLVGLSGEVIGMIGVARPLNEISAARDGALRLFGGAAAVLALLVLGEAVLLARLITRPIQRLTRATQTIAAGDLATPVESAGDDEIGVLGQSIEAMRAQLAQMVSALEHERNRYRDFLAMVPHEFKTPLAAMGASLELMESGDEALAPNQRVLLASVRRSVIRLQRLIENLLDSASIDLGQFRVHPEAHSLRPIVEEARQSVQPLLDQKRQALQVELAAELPPAMADPRRVTQVLVNLLVNAHKYGPAGEPITLGAIRDGDTLRVSVQDCGPGIPLDRQSDLFRRFGRLGAGGRNEAPGIGLGLAIVEEIVRQHGGRVGVSSGDGRGATLWFTLPIATVAQADL